MPLWGTTTADESRPKWLTPFEAKDVTAQREGWVQFNDNPAKREVLVAVGGLEDTLGAPSIADVRILPTLNGQYANEVVEISSTNRAAAHVDVIFNEPIKVTGTRTDVKLQLTRTDGTSGNASITMSLVSAEPYENVLRFNISAANLSGNIGNSYRPNLTTINITNARTKIEYAIKNVAQSGQNAVLTTIDNTKINTRGPNPLIKFV